jgi:hypothetical protein
MEIGMMKPSADCAPGSPADIARLRKHLEHLVAVSEGVFSKPIQFDAASDYAFMALSFP